jgi:hypothetical protein
MGYLNDLGDDLFENARAHGFHDDSPAALHETFVTKEAFETYERFYNGNRLMLIVGELSEAHEEIRNGYFVNEVYYGHSGRNGTHKKPEGVPIEMTDALIRILETMRAWGIDIDASVKLKAEYNATRAHKHGKTM